MTNGNPCGMNAGWKGEIAALTAGAGRQRPVATPAERAAKRRQEQRAQRDHDAARILAVMQPARGYQRGELKRLTGADGIDIALRHLVRQRQIDETMDHDGTFYSLPC